MIRNTGTRRPGLTLAATAAALVVLIILLVPVAAGATESRDRRDGGGEKTPEPIVLEVATPPIQASGGDDPDPLPGVATVEADPIVLVAGGGTEHPGHGACPDGFRYELLLKEEADGSLWWMYGCVPNDPGLPPGPGDFATTR